MALPQDLIMKYFFSKIQFIQKTKHENTHCNQGHLTTTLVKTELIWDCSSNDSMVK